MRRSFGIFIIPFLSIAGSLAPAQEALRLDPADHGRSILISSSDLHDSTSSDKSPDQRPELVRERYPNGAIRVERYVMESSSGDFVNHGSYVEYGEDGSLLVSGAYELGKRKGTWSRVIDSKQVAQLSPHAAVQFTAPFISRADYQDGVLEGSWQVVDSAGRLVLDWEYHGGKKEGSSKWFGPEGEPLILVEYDQDVAHGKAILPDAAGHREVNFEKGMYAQRFDSWYTPGANGSKQLKSVEWFLIPGQFNVESSDWQGSLIVYQKPDPSRKIRHGQVVTYFPNGQIESEGSYEHGARMGAFVWWYPNGQQKIAGEYQHDLETGVWNWWHANGMREARGQYASGQKTEEWSVWDASGKLVRRDSTHGEVESRTAKLDLLGSAIDK